MKSFTKLLHSTRNWKSLHEAYGAAKIKGHPEIIKVPENFRWHRHFEQLPLPRGTSGKPMNFVLTVLFYNQPCRLDGLWSKCMEISGIPLDSRRHLRQVVHQARMEGWVFFEKKNDHWYVNFCQERYEEVKYLVTKWRSDWIKAIDGNPRQSDATKSTANFSGSCISDRQLHMEKMRTALLEANKRLQNFERTTIDYLPYTDPNGKVNFFHWYELRTFKNSNSGAYPLEANREPHENINTRGLSPLSRAL